MAEVSVVFVTVSSGEEAQTIGQTLVREKLAACANIIPRIRSIYWWKGAICNDEEVLMVLKTRSSLFPALKARVRELHSYDVPEIVAFPLAQGLPEYIDWVLQNTRQE